MKTTSIFKPGLGVLLAASVVLMSVTMDAQAQRAARASVNHAGGGGHEARPAAQHNNANVQRNSNNRNNVNVNNSHNNVNVNRDVNVNVDGDHGRYYDDHDHYHPVATAAAVTATVAVTSAVVGSIVNANQMPSSCVQVMRGNTAYMQCGSTWYQPQYQGSNVTYVVVNAP
ncbi:hypothetical protein [Silvimonas amylolytica]|uniref:Secreted protein n=1 Tax=Silvimonas amylolytica TaxID=449663 RepID=A0ABQ2PHU2_9NEIS|nr:hypothetical protein [Silvimonas amylolytica]GGP24880.1 hypothetical protein GCM10010971_06990 [Silvimonas amylolytica]